MTPAGKYPQMAFIGTRRRMLDRVNVIHAAIAQPLAVAFPFRIAHHAIPLIKATIKGVAIMSRLITKTTAVMIVFASVL
jgi:hypothetical protein